MSELVSIVLLPQGRDAVRFRASTSMSWQEFKDGARTRCGSSRLNEAEDLEFYVNNGLVKLVSTSDLVEGDKVLVVPAKQQQQQDQGALPVSALTPFGRRRQHHHNRDRDTYLEVEGCVDVKEQQREFLRRGNSAGAELPHQQHYQHEHILGAPSATSLYYAASYTNHQWHHQQHPRDQHHHLVTGIEPTVESVSAAAEHYRYGQQQYQQPIEAWGPPCLPHVPSQTTSQYCGRVGEATQESIRGGGYTYAVPPLPLLHQQHFQQGRLLSAPSASSHQCVPAFVNRQQHHQQRPRDQHHQLQTVAPSYLPPAQTLAKDHLSSVEQRQARSTYDSMQHQQHQQQHQQPQQCYHDHLCQSDLDLHHQAGIGATGCHSGAADSFRGDRIPISEPAQSQVSAPCLRELQAAAAHPRSRESSEVVTAFLHGGGLGFLDGADLTWALFSLRSHVDHIVLRVPKDRCTERSRLERATPAKGPRRHLVFQLALALERCLSLAVLDVKWDSKWGPTRYESIGMARVGVDFPRPLAPSPHLRHVRVLRLALVPLDDPTLDTLASHCSALRELDLQRDGHLGAVRVPWGRGLGSLLAANLSPETGQLAKLNLANSSFNLTTADFQGWFATGGHDDFPREEHFGKCGSLRELVLTNCNLGSAGDSMASIGTLGALRLLTGALAVLDIKGVVQANENDEEESRHCLEEEVEERRVNSANLVMKIVQDSVLGSVLEANMATLVDLKCGGCPGPLLFEASLEEITPSLESGGGSGSGQALKRLNFDGLDYRFISNGRNSAVGRNLGTLLDGLSGLRCLEELNLARCGLGGDTWEVVRVGGANAGAANGGAAGVSVLRPRRSRVLELTQRLLPLRVTLRRLRLDGNPALGVACGARLFGALHRGELLLEEVGLSRAFLGQGGEVGADGVLTAKVARVDSEDGSEDGSEYSAEGGGGGGARQSALFEEVPVGGALPTLKDLDLSGNSLASLDLARVPELCPALEGLALGVSDCPGHYFGRRGELTDVPAAALVAGLTRHCPRVARLRLHRLKRDWQSDGEDPMPEAFGRFLEVRGKQLAVLELEGAPTSSHDSPKFFGPGTLPRLAELCPHLETLKFASLWTLPDEDTYWREISVALPRCAISTVSGKVYGPLAV